MKTFKLFIAIIAIAFFNSCTEADPIEALKIKFDGEIGAEIEIKNNIKEDKIKIPYTIFEDGVPFSKKDYKKARTREILTFTNTTKEVITTVVWEQSHQNILKEGYWTEKGTATPFELLIDYYKEDTFPDFKSIREGYIPREELYKILEEKNIQE